MFPLSRKRRRPTVTRMRRPVDVTIRRAFPDDAEAVRRLATLDGAKPPRTELLVAEVAGELWAAVTIDGAVAIADPFRPTAELVDLLRTRAEHIRTAQDGALAPVRRLV